MADGPSGEGDAHPWTVAIEVGALAVSDRLAMCVCWILHAASGSASCHSRALIAREAREQSTLGIGGAVMLRLTRG